MGRGKSAVRWPIEAMSATRSVVNLAFGRLWWLMPETRTTIVDEERSRKMREKGVPAVFLAKAPSI